MALDDRPWITVEPVPFRVADARRRAASECDALVNAARDLGRLGLGPGGGVSALDAADR